MNRSKRNFLTLIGGGVVLAATGTGAFLGTRTPHSARAPWATAGSQYSDPRLAALSWAILAPNPHNRQPWMVRLDGDTGFTLFAETDRKLPHTDPLDRQITIGLGCFLELARLAAADLGYRMQITPFPAGEPTPILDQRPVAHVEMLPGADPDPLFGYVPLRRSCKEPFDMTRPVTQEQLTRLAKHLAPQVRFDGTIHSEQVADLRDMVWQGHQVEVQTPRTYLESVELMRIGKAEIEANPDGLDLGGPFLETLKLFGVLNRQQLSDMTSSAYQQGLDMYQEIMAATPAFVWLSTPANSRLDQLAAGQQWLRLNLAATAQGLALHPVSQILQEYPEMTPLRTAAHTLLTDAPDERVQMLGRLGYGPGIPPSPRWPLETRLISS